MLPKLRLNLGCGSNKIDGCVNVDVNPDLNPDLVADFTKTLPFDSNSVDAVYFFHVIEHIPKTQHQSVLYEISRILKPGCSLYMSYPEFLKCVECYKENRYGKRDFWEATIYGRQLYPSDTHVALMDTPFVIRKLKALGFYDIVSKPEPVEDWNTTISCKKGFVLTHEHATRINLGF